MRKWALFARFCSTLSTCKRRRRRTRIESEVVSVLPLFLSSQPRLLFILSPSLLASTRGVDLSATQGKARSEAQRGRDPTGQPGPSSTGSPDVTSFLMMVSIETRSPPPRGAVFAPLVPQAPDLTSQISSRRAQRRRCERAKRSTRPRKAAAIEPRGRRHEGRSPSKKLQRAIAILLPCLSLFFPPPPSGQPRRACCSTGKCITGSRARRAGG